MSESIRINFGKPIPLFPLHEVVLLPHAILPLHIFEARYRQMVNDCLDQAGQIAIASFANPCQKTCKVRNDDRPDLRPVVCVGQIVQHEGMPDGRHNILLHGVCRARIDTLHEPDDERLYWMADLAPLEPDAADPPALPQVRKKLRSMLAGPRLSRLRSVETVMEWFDREDIPTHALLELIGFTLVQDNNIKYRLLAEPDIKRRAELIRSELSGLDSLVKQADQQSYADWPKGMSWN